MCTLNCCKCGCGDYDEKPTRLCKSTYLLKKTIELFGDPFGCKMINRHCILLNEYIMLSSSGIAVAHVPNLLNVLDHLATHCKDVPEYNKLLHSLLMICCKPLLPCKPTQGLYVQSIEHLFDMYGYLIVLLQDSELRLGVVCAIYSLLMPPEPGNSLRIHVSTCLSAVKKSQLAVTVGEFLEVADETMFPILINLSLLLASICPTLGLQMADVDIMNSVLIRLDPYFPIRIEIPGLYDRTEVTEMIINLTWTLLYVIQTESDQTDLHPPSLESLCAIRSVLQSTVLNGKSKLRNKLMALVVLMMDTFPDIRIVESGLAYDIVLLSVASELGTEGTWAENVTFSAKPFDVELKRTLWVGVCYLAKYPSAIEILRSQRVVTSIMQLIKQDPEGTNILWSRFYIRPILNIALRVLAILIQCFPHEFAYTGTTTRILLLIEQYLREPFDQDMLVSCLIVMMHLISLDKQEFVKDLGDQGGIGIFLRVCQHSLDKPQMQHLDQRVMTLCFILLERLIRNNTFFQECYGPKSVQLMLILLDRFTKKELGRFPYDERLLLSALDYLWESVVWYPKNSILFVQEGGVYKLLDLLESSIFPVQMLLLSVLVDLLESGKCVPHFVTWRDREGKGYLPLLLNIWRVEERRLNVSRSCHWSLADTERPLMGQLQHFLTFDSHKEASTSPAITDIYVSVRPKIHAIVQMLSHRFKEHVEESELRYQMYNTPSLPDKVTGLIVQNFLALKMGEVWAEVANDLQSMSIVPTGADAILLGKLARQVCDWAVHIQTQQMEIIQQDKDKRIKAEREMQIREFNTAAHLEVLQDLEVLAVNMDKIFRARQKKREREQVIVEFPKDAAPNLCYRTYKPHHVYKMRLEEHYRVPQLKLNKEEIPERSPFREWNWHDL